MNFCFYCGKAIPLCFSMIAFLAFLPFAGLRVRFLLVK